MRVGFMRGLLCAGSLALALTAGGADIVETLRRARGTFATPQQAADALIAAAEAFDVAALESIFGAEGRDLVVTGDAVQDKNRAARVRRQGA